MQRKLSFCKERLLDLLLIFCLSFSVVQAQSPYEFNGTTDGVIFGSSIGLLTFSHFKNKKIEPLTVKQINQLNRDNLFAIDRRATYNYSKTAQKTSDYLLYSSVAIPMTMLLGERSRNDFGKTGLFTLQALLLNSALTGFTKVMTKRTRPYAYNEFVEINKKLSKGTRTSFFSGHTSTVASMYFLTAKLYSDYYPESKWKPAVWTAAIAIPATTGLLRMKGGKHFFTDVLVGFIVGATVGYLIPEIHRITE